MSAFKLLLVVLSIIYCQGEVIEITNKNEKDVSIEKVDVKPCPEAEQSCTVDYRTESAVNISVTFTSKISAKDVKFRVYETGREILRSKNAIFIDDKNQLTKNIEANRQYTHVFYYKLWNFGPVPQPEDGTENISFYLWFFEGLSFSFRVNFRVINLLM